MSGDPTGGYNVLQHGTSAYPAAVHPEQHGWLYDVGYWLVSTSAGTGLLILALGLLIGLLAHGITQSQARQDARDLAWVRAAARQDAQARLKAARYRRPERITR